MPYFPIFPAILIACLLACILAGLSVLSWGKRMPRHGDWLVGVALLALLAVTLFCGESLIGDELRAKAWQKGWIWPHGDLGAITIGVLQDGIGLTMAFLTGLIALLALFNKALIEDEARPERLHCAIALSASGVCLSWLSLTPWLSFAGIALTILGGFLSLGSQWESDEEAHLATRFVWERTGGLLISILGACGLASSRLALVFTGAAEASGGWTAVASKAGTSDAVGAFLLVIGLAVQLQTFPFLGWLVSASRVPSWPKLLLTQIFPGWAAFSLLLRLYGQMGQMGQIEGFSVFLIMGWFLLASSLLAAVSGLLQFEWKSGLTAWIGSGLTLSAAVLAFSGRQSALSLLLGLSLGGLAMATAARTRTTAAKVTGIVGTAAATGVIGFVSVSGGLEWLTQAWRQQPAVMALCLLVFFFYVLLGWKQAWIMLRSPAATEMHWSALTLPCIFIVLSLGLVWTGSLSGHALPGELDRVMPSLFQAIFGSSAGVGGSGEPLFSSDEQAFAAASSGFWATLLLGIGAGYWASLKLRNRPQGRIGKLVASGYGIDQAAEKSLGLVTWLAGRIQWLIDEKIWKHWIPDGIDAGMNWVAGTMDQADQMLSRFTGRVLSRWIDAPARFVQLIQSGDVQWYLIFALGSGLAIMAHFLRG